MPHEVHHAELYLCLRVDGLYRLGEALQAIYAGDEDVLHSAVLQFGDDLHPELRALGFSGPHAEHFFQAVEVDPKGDIDGLVHDPPLALDLHLKCIEVEDRIDGVEWAVKAAGLVDFRFHDLRHTAATRMADAGADAFTLAAILAHSDIRMTSRYTHATDEARRRAVETLAAAPQVGNG